MHILIANHRLDEPAGTETYVVTLAGRLVAAGHRVTCFSPHLGETASLRDGIDRREIQEVPQFRRSDDAPGPAASRARAMLHSKYHDGPLRRALSEPATAVGAELRIVGGNRRQLDIVSEINHADAVVGIGRSAIEAMACGRPALLYSAYGGDASVIRQPPTAGWRATTTGSPPGSPRIRGAWRGSWPGSMGSSVRGADAGSKPITTPTCSWRGSSTCTASPSSGSMRRWADPAARS